MALGASAVVNSMEKSKLLSSQEGMISFDCFMTILMQMRRSLVCIINLYYLTILGEVNSALNKFVLIVNDLRVLLVIVRLVKYFIL